MKKVILSGFIIATMGITIIGCKKEKVETVNQTSNLNSNSEGEGIESIDNNDYTQLKVNNGVLEFGSIEYYESLVDNSDYNVIDNLEKKIKSLTYTTYKDKYPNDTIFQEHFTETLLNPDKVVKIGNWFLLIEPNTSLVYAISDEVDNCYEKLLSNNDENISAFSFDDNVLEILSNDNNNLKWGCNETSAPTANNTYHWDTYCGNYRIKFKAAYYTIGIYKKLRIEWWHDEKWGTDDFTNFAVGYKYSWKKKCKNEIGQNTVNMPGYYPYWGNWGEIKFYSGTKSLSKYYIGNLSGTGGPTLAYKNKCTGYKAYITLYYPLKHGY